MSGAAQRWAAFLKQIEDRHAAVCAEAVEGSKAAVAVLGADVTPIAHAWMAVTDRLHELERRILDTWDEKVCDVFEAEGAPPDVQARERRKGEDLAFELENRRDRAEMLASAEGARELHRRALAAEPARACVRCGAPLDVPPTYRAVNLTCPHCHSLVTFEPGTLARAALASGSHALAREAAHPEWLAMRHAERAIRDVRSPTPLGLLKAYERAQIAYWFKYVGARAHLEPELRDLPLEVRSRMHHWWTSAESEEEWRRAGSPREPI